MVPGRLDIKLGVKGLLKVQRVQKHTICGTSAAPWEAVSPLWDAVLAVQVLLLRFLVHAHIGGAPASMQEPKAQLPCGSPLLQPR